LPPNKNYNALIIIKLNYNNRVKNKIKIQKPTLKVLYFQPDKGDFCNMERKQFTGQNQQP
jgi:hypothetical protein